MAGTSKPPEDRNAKARALFAGARNADGKAAQPSSAATQPAAQQPSRPIASETERLMAPPEGPAGAAPTAVPGTATTAPAATAPAPSFDQVERENARLEGRLGEAQRRNEEIERRIKEGRQRNEELGQRIEALHRDGEETLRQVEAVPAPSAAPTAQEAHAAWLTREGIQSPEPAGPKDDSLEFEPRTGIRAWFDENKKKITIIAAGLVALVAAGTITGYALKANFENKARKATAAAKLEETRKADAAKKAKEAAEAEKKRKADEAVKKAEAEKKARVRAMAEAIVRRCQGPSSQSLRQEPPFSAHAKALCLTRQEADRLATNAAMLRELESFKDAGIKFLEVGDVANAKAMSAQCARAKDTACVRELSEQIQVMGKALVLADLMQRSSEPLLEKKEGPAPSTQPK